MNKDRQLELFKKFTAEQEKFILSKGDDYAGEDRLSNFKYGGNISGIKPEQHCLALIATKVARLGQLFSGKEAKHESIKDTLVDLANYCFLEYCIVDEKDLKFVDYINPKDFELSRSINHVKVQKNSEPVVDIIPDSHDLEDNLVVKRGPSSPVYSIEDCLEKRLWRISRKDSKDITASDILECRLMLRSTNMCPKREGNRLQIISGNLILTSEN